MSTKPKPKKLTHSQIIMNHMLTGQTISNTQAYDLYNMTDCIRRISDLRTAGVLIQDEFINCNGKYFKKYWISESDRPIDDEATK